MIAFNRTFKILTDMTKIAKPKRERTGSRNKDWWEQFQPQLQLGL